MVGRLPGSGRHVGLCGEWGGDGVGQGTGGLGKVCEGVRCGDGWPGGLWVAVGGGVGMTYM
jgi:hypothetical protein